MRWPCVRQAYVYKHIQMICHCEHGLSCRILKRIYHVFSFQELAYCVFGAPECAHIQSNGWKQKRIYKHI